MNPSNWTGTLGEDWTPGGGNPVAPLQGREDAPRSFDLRDCTPEPPAYLDPASVLRNRRRVETYIKTGRWTWPTERTTDA